MHFHIGSGQCIVSLDFIFFKSGPQKSKKPVIFTLFALSLVPTVGLLQILRIEAHYEIYTSLGFKAHSKKNRTRIAYAIVENGCVKNRLLVIVSSVAMDTTSSPAAEKKSAPQNKSAPQKKSRRAFGASATLARRRFSNNKAKFE